MFEFSSIGHYHSQLKKGDATCIQAANHYLQRIHAHKTLNAFVHVYEDEVLEKAAILDKKLLSGKPLGKLFGVIISLKDVIAYKDHLLTAASGILKKFTSLYSATVVEKLLAEDAIIIGHTNCDEFGMGSANENSAYGVTRNFLDEDRTPGGSSGGSAVSVQAGLCMVSLGSDTGGSVRQPADHCGIVGIKPTYGRISRFGLVAYASSFDQVGIFTNNIEDAALVLEVIAGKDDYDSTVSENEVPSYSSQINSPGKSTYKIAYLKQALEHPSLDPVIRSAINNEIENLKSQGHHVKGVEFDLLDFAVPTYYVLTTAEASSNLSRYDGVKYGYANTEPGIELTDFYKSSRSAGFGKEVQRRIMLGTFVLSSGYHEAYFTRAQQVRQKIRQQIELVFNEFDFIILPTVPHTASLIGEAAKDPIAVYLADVFTVLANLTGLPALTVPLFKHNNSLPFGLQIMSNRFNELPLLRFSNQMLLAKR